MQQKLVGDKFQIVWGIEIFSTFLKFAAMRGSLDQALTQRFKIEIEKMLIEAERGTPPEIIAEKLNEMIGECNTAAKNQARASQYVPFPMFSLINATHHRSAVLDQIDMLERTLREASEAKVLDWEQESEHFTSIVHMFSLVEKGKLTKEEAMAQLSFETEKINAALPEEFHFPKVNIAAYE